MAVGVVVSKNHSSSSSNANVEDDDSTAGVVNQTNPDDPSTFIKDPALKQSFYGIAYTPEGSQYPECGNSLGKWFARSALLPIKHVLTTPVCTEQVITDIQVSFRSLFG